MKKYRAKEAVPAVLFFAGFLCGILFVNLWGNIYLKEDGLLGADALRLIAGTETDARTLFFFLLLRRGRVYLFLLLLGYTIAGLAAGLLFLVWLGAAAGVLISIFVIRMRLLGVLLFLSAVLPQALFYAPCVWMLTGGIWERWMQCYKKHENPTVWKQERAYLRTALFGAALLLFGIVLESCANPWLIRQTANYFL